MICETGFTDCLFFMIVSAAGDTRRVSLKPQHTPKLTLMISSHSHSAIIAEAENRDARESGMHRNIHSFRPSDFGTISHK